MAQDFRNDLQGQIGTSDQALLTAGNYDAVIGIRCCNIVSSTILVDVKIANGGNDFFLAKRFNSTKFCNRINSRWREDSFKKWRCA